MAAKLAGHHLQRPLIVGVHLRQRLDVCSLEADLSRFLIHIFHIAQDGHFEGSGGLVRPRDFFQFGNQGRDRRVYFVWQTLQPAEMFVILLEARVELRQ